MVRLLALALAAYCYLQTALLLADDAAGQLAGSWKLTAWTIQIIGGELTEPMGHDPKGRAVFTPDGHVAFIITAANRKPRPTMRSRQPCSRVFLPTPAISQ